MKQRTPSSNPNQTLQVVFLAGVFGLFLAQAIQTGMQIISQLPTNQNLSGFMWWLVPGFALPLLMVLVAILAKRDRSLNIRNMFEVTLLVVSVSLIGSLISAITSTITMNAHLVLNDYLPYFILYTGIPTVTSIVTFVILLAVLRRKKQW